MLRIQVPKALVSLFDIYLYIYIVNTDRVGNPAHCIYLRLSRLGLCRRSPLMDTEFEGFLPNHYWLYHGFYHIDLCCSLFPDRKVPVFLCMSLSQLYPIYILRRFQIAMVEHALTTSRGPRAMDKARGCTLGLIHGPRAPGSGKRIRQAMCRARIQIVVFL